ncbi:MAG: tetratricopeptide repeat protein, partial [Planctomycetota bacterium]
PKNPTFYNKLAGIYQRKGEIDDALTQYRKAISIAPDDVTANLGVGILLEIKGLLDESVKVYQKVIELDADSKIAYNKNVWMAYNNLALIYATKMKNKMDEAVKLAERANELVPDNPAVNDTLGWIYYLDAKYDKAASLLRIAVRDETWNPTIRYHLGMVYYKKGLQREAITEMERALKISNTFPEAEEAEEVIEKIMLSRINDLDNRLQD